MTGERLDVELVRRGLVETRSRAQALIGAGEVLVAGARCDKAGTRVPPEVDIRVVEPAPYVSRGGQKLAAALDAFSVLPTGRVAADLGASTGGFTDCLLQRGAARVYAIDVGYGQLAWSLRSDPRVVVMERTNARHLESLPEVPSLVVGDLSFISLALILPAIHRIAAPEADIVLLVKPQFEVGRADVGKGGRVTDAEARARAIAGVVEVARSLGFRLVSDMPSPILGAKSGNIEHLVHLTPGALCG